MTVYSDQLISRGQQLSELDQLYQLRDLLQGYVLKNLLLIGQSDQALAETFINPNLYALAVQYYGSVDYWTVIAKANPQPTDPNNKNPDPYDPQINGVVTLLIPPKPALSPESILNP